MSNYNYYCGNCLYRLGEDDLEDHEEKFHCKGELLEEFDDFKLYGKYWIYDIFDQLEVAEDLLYFDVSKTKENLFFSDRIDLENYLYGRRPRIAYILIDNAVELLLYGKIFLSKLKDTLDKKEIKKVKNYMDEKIRILTDKGIITEDEGNHIKFFHTVRNKLYHNIIPDRAIFIKLANTYIVFCRNLLKTIYDVIYPIIYYKANVFIFEDKEIIDTLLTVLKKSLPDLKKNIISMKEIYDSYEFVSKRYRNEKMYLLDTLNGYYGFKDENGKYLIPTKYETNTIASLLNSFIQIKKKKLDTAQQIRNVIGEIFKYISEISQINYILDSSIEMHYYQVELFEEFDR